jgi:TP901 family phage tail tape measure protein
MANRKIKAELEFQGKDNTSAAFRSVAARMGQIEKQMSSFNRTSSEFTRRVQGIQRATSASGKGLQQVSAGLETAGVALRAGVAGLGAAAVGSGIKDSIVDFAALERQMSRIGMTAGVSKEETDAALQSMKAQAKDLALPLSEAVSALQVMTSAGLDFRQAMAFLPSVLATTQAAGASAADMASTTVQAAGALKISAGEMQRAFDIINEAGKAGSFEANDMARYLPGLANGFAALGYKGTEAVGELSAYMQTLRAHTADASTAANQMENILSKMNSDETRNRFKKFGINLEMEMKKRTAAGQKPLEAFIDIARKALNGDLSKISQLFGDMQVQQGMLSLVSDAETFRRVIAIINSARVDGSVQRDNQRLLGETQASIDRMAESWRQLKSSFGEGLAPIAVPIIDQEVKALDLHNARQRGMQKRGWSWARRQIGLMTGNEPLDLAYEGGYRDPAFLAEYWESRYGRGLDDPTRPKASRGRQNMPVVRPEFPGGGGRYTVRNLPTTGAPIPGARPAMPVTSTNAADAEAQRQRMQYGSGRQLAADQAAAIANANVFRVIQERIDRSAQESARATAEGGEKAGAAIKEGAQALDSAGGGLVQGLLSVVDNLRGLVRELGSTTVNVRNGGAAIGGMAGRPQVNADTGRTMPPATFGPK